MSTLYCGCDPTHANGYYYCERHLKGGQMEDHGRQVEVYSSINKAFKVPAMPTLVLGPTRASTLPEDAKERKKYPLATGLFDYFPDALLAVANVSWVGNEQHNPGEPLHWARGKSMDQDDTCLRHFIERGKFDKDGVRHTAKAAWRILALLQLEIEAAQKEGK